MSSPNTRVPPLPAPLRPCSFDKDRIKEKLTSRVEHLEKNITVRDDGLLLYQLGSNGIGVIIRVTCAENLFIVRADYIGVYPLLKTLFQPEDLVRLYEELLKLSRVGISFELQPNNVLSAKVAIPVTVRWKDFDAYDLTASAVLYLLGIQAWFSYLLLKESFERVGAPVTLLAISMESDDAEWTVDPVSGVAWD